MADGESMAGGKAMLRVEMAARRDAIPFEERAQAAQAIARQAPTILSLLQLEAGLKGPRTLVVSGYLPIRSELDPRPLMQVLARAGAHLCLPVVQGRGRPLLFRSWSSGDAMDTVAWGLREPKVDRPVVLPDVMLLPLLAVDRSCNRLGYGAGYYDRTIAAIRADGRTVLTVAVAFDQQIIDVVPRMPYDEVLDVILTPSGFFEGPGFRERVHGGNSGSGC